MGMGLDDVPLRRLNAHFDMPLPFNGRISILYDAFKAKTIVL